MTKKTLIKRSGSKRSAKRFLMFRLAAVAVLVSAFVIFGFLAKNTMAQSWSEPSAAPPAGNVSAPVWTQNSLVQTGNFWLSGKGRLDASGTGDATCQGAKVCLADSTGGYGLVSEMTSGTGGAGPAVYAQGNAGFGIYASSTSNYAGDFVGNVYVTGTLNAATDLQVNGTQVCLSNGTHCQTGGYWTATGNDIYNNNTGKVGIGTSTPLGPLNVKVATDAQFTVFNSSSSVALQAGNDANNTYKLMYLDASPLVLNKFSGGKVGIGTTTPAATLDVKGAVNFSGATSGYMAVAVPAAVTSYTLTFPAAVGASGQVLQTTNATGTLGWVTPSAGGVQTPWAADEAAASHNLTGLGTNLTAAAGLTIASTGAALALNSGSGALTSNATTVTLGGSATMYGGAAASGNLTLDSTSSGTKGFTIINPSGGNVGIGTTAPAATLDVKGAVNFSGATSGYMAVAVPAAVTSYTLTFPAAVGASGQVLQTTNATGTLGWVTPSAGGVQTPWAADEAAASHNLTGLGTNLTAAAGLTIASTGAALALNSGSGALTSNATTVTLGGSATMYGGAAASGNLTLDSTSSGTKGFTIINPSGGKVGIGTTTPAATLDVKGAVNFSGATSGYMAVAVPAAVTSYTLTFPAAVGASGQVLQTTNGTGTLGWVTPAAGGGTVTSSGSANYVPLFTTATNIGNSVIQQSGSSIGIGVSPTHGVLDSEATANTGVYGSSTNALYYGVQGVNTSNTGGSGTGVYGLSSATGGNGVRGDETSASGVNSGATGNDSSPQGYGVVGYNSSLTGTAVGVYGDNSSTSGVGVLGSTFAVSGTTYGVEGTTASASGYGLYTPNRASAAQYCISGANCISAWPSGGSGTVTNSGSAANYVAKFSSSTNITDSLIYDNGTKVGIGTTTPGAYMDVEAGLSGSVAVKGISTNNVGVDGESTGSTGVLGVSTNGNGVVGQSSASLFAGVEGQSNSASAYGVWGSNTAGGYGVYSSGAIYSTGNITAGAGTSISAPTLQSTGNTFVNATLFAAAVQSSGSVTGASSAAFGPAIYGTASAASGYGLYGNNSAGGGSAIAVYGVTWAGGYGFYTSQNSYVGGTLTAGSISSGNITGGAGSTFTAPSITATGNAWVNASLTVGGNVFAAGFIPNSDIRLKKNIKPLNEDDGLNIVGQLNPVTFNWKDTTKGTNLNYGFIAQDMQKVLPDLVSANNDGMLGINYNGLIAPMVKSIQEQQKEIDDLKLQIAQLKAK